MRANINRLVVNAASITVNRDRRGGVQSPFVGLSPEWNISPPFINHTAGPAFRKVTRMKLQESLLRYLRAILSGISLLILLVPAASDAQPWSGIIQSDRAVDWSAAGVSGGIPPRTTICATLNPGATISQINSAIANCPSGQVVYLNAGTYNLGSGLISLKNNVTLAGLARIRQRFTLLGVETVEAFRA